MKKVLVCMLQLHKNSGSARTALEHIKYFQARNFEVHVAALTMNKAELKKLGVVPHKMLPYLKSTGITRRRWYNWQVQRLRKKMSFDLTVGHGDIQDQDVLTLHNCVFYASELIHGKPLPADHEMSLTHGPQLREVKFRRMIANSELMKADTVKRFGVPAEKILVVYPAVDVKTFHPVSVFERNQQRKRFGFADDQLIVSLVTSGNFRKRGLDLFIEAIKTFPPIVHQRVSFRVLGKDEHNEYQNQPVTFDPGLSDIQNYYRAIDVFVLPARIEEFGRVVLEAMASGLPVITTDKVGAGELITGEARDFVIPSHNASALADAIVRLIKDQDLRERVGQINYKTAQKESEEAVFPKFDRVFLDI